MFDMLMPRYPNALAVRRSAVTSLLLVCLSGVWIPTASAGPAQDKGSEGVETEFTRENEVAMSKMMAGMHVPPTGDVDRDFVAMMVPHHQGAIDMAVAVLRHGRNPKLKRIAQQIIIEQQQEIATMLLAIGEPLPPSSPAPTHPDLAAGSRVETDHHHSASN